MITISIIGIILLVALIIYILVRKKDNDSWFDGFLDALLISDAIEAIGSIVSSLGTLWKGDGGGFSGGGSSGSWDFDFDD